MLHQLHHEGLTIVVSTPYMDEAEYATRLGFLASRAACSTSARARDDPFATRDSCSKSAPRSLGGARRAWPGAAIDDVSLFGTVLHVRGAGRGGALMHTFNEL